MTIVGGTSNKVLGRKAGEIDAWAAAYGSHVLDQSDDGQSLRNQRQRGEAHLGCARPSASQSRAVQAFQRSEVVEKLRDVAGRNGDCRGIGWHLTLFV